MLHFRKLHQCGRQARQAHGCQGSPHCPAGGGYPACPRDGRLPLPPPAPCALLGQLPAYIISLLVNLHVGHLIDHLVDHLVNLHDQHHNISNITSISIINYQSLSVKSSVGIFTYQGHISQLGSTVSLTHSLTD